MGRHKEGIFTKTELRILAAMADGCLSTADLMARLGMSENVVDVHRSHIYKKCGVHDRQGLQRLLISDVMIRN